MSKPLWHFEEISKTDIFEQNFKDSFQANFKAPLAFSSKFKAPATFSSNSFDQVKRFQCQEQQIQGQRVVNSTSVED